MGQPPMLPPFTSDGLLPPGDYPMTLDDLRNSHLVLGPRDGSPWDHMRRAHLVDNLEVLVNQLWQVGIDEIFIDGSFVEDKASPHDIDGYFVCKLFDLKTGELQMSLNALESSRCWTWADSSRRPHPDSTKSQLPMWHQYRVELYPHTNLPRDRSGIRDQHGHALTFPALFRQQRDTELEKGIVRIVKPQ